MVREDAGGGHRDVQIATRDRQRPDDRLPRTRLRIGGVLPLEPAGFDEDQMPHVPLPHRVG